MDTQVHIRYAMAKVRLNDLARRHWVKTGYSKTSLTQDELCKLVEDNLSSCKPGPEDGIIYVYVDASSFETPLRTLCAGDKVTATFEPRMDGEEAVLNTRHTQGYTQADVAEIVLYRHDTLGSDASTDADWEIVSINASCSSHGKVPMAPVAMARNFLAKVGGTKADYTAKEFAEAIWFWATHSLGE